MYGARAVVKCFRVAEPSVYPGRKPLFSPIYIPRAVPIVFKLFIQKAARLRSRAWLRAGSSIAARIAMIAMTTRSSIKVKFPDFTAVRVGENVFMSQSLNFYGLKK